MPSPVEWVSRFRTAIALVALIGAAVLLSSSDTPVYTQKDKAFYADPNLVNFVRPGLVLKILSASIESDGTIKARFRITDPKGLPLDMDGVTTPGTVSVRLVAAYIPKGQTQYVAYTTWVQTSPITGASATQANYDSGGTFAKVGEGEYVYTFRTKAPADFDRTATHSIGAWASRNLAEFDLQSIINYDDDVYTWVPDGSKATVVRDVIKTSTCNKCHDPLSAHDNRRSMELCVLCHTP
ncbi:MAG: OmcA/MtrC family decaheme c-type cytochrome, partial [Bryobacteraceae bacterium]